MSNSSEVFMARQPIYDRQMRLVGYELLYRSSQTNNAAGNMGPQEAARSLVNSIVDFGLGGLVGGKRAFLNLDESLLNTEAAFMLPRDQVVIEILESVRNTPENIHAVRRLYRAGYQIALDDYDAGPKAAAFAPFAKVLKWDVLAQDRKLAQNVEESRRKGLGMLAEKVETREQFEGCKRLGFEYFQGYFFSKPEILHNNTIPANKLAALQIVSKLHDPGLKIEDLEELVAQDLALTHRLLKMIRCAQLGLSTSVRSVRQAVLFLGLRTVGALATLLVLSSRSEKPDELLVTALVRARACEELAKAMGISRPEPFFTAGLLSVIDAVLGSPMPLLLQELPLSDDINEALIHPEAETDLARVLSTVIQFEHGSWSGDESAANWGTVNRAYRTAVDYANAAGSPRLHRDAA